MLFSGEFLTSGKILQKKCRLRFQSWVFVVLCLFLFANSSLKAAGISETPEVDRIEFRGIYASGNLIKESDFKATLEISTGDRVDRQKIARSIENLKRLYKTHGYEKANVKVSFQPKDRVLEFSVDEGPLTRIFEVQVRQTQRVDTESELPAWRRIQEELISKARVSLGENYD